MTWLDMNSVAVVGVTLILLSSPISLSRVNDWATIMVKKIDAKANKPGAKNSNVEVAFA